MSTHMERVSTHACYQVSVRAPCFDSAGLDAQQTSLAAGRWMDSGACACSACERALPAAAAAWLAMWPRVFQYNCHKLRKQAEIYTP